ncbi:hypothetical protein VNO78_04619 [Psophocarpus tetragonolobus]|uniref:Uncharacterized protein n=1 Tax=Psophocarpus tetragonolobus TaxID=3891 RepID=A0AAN9XWW0_PSOTE
MSSRLLKNILEMIEADEAQKGSNSNRGTLNSFNNHGNGSQNFSGAKINSGTNSGDRNSYRTSNHYGGRTINNTGTFNGNGNGGFIDGGFNSSTTNYYR